MFFQLILMSGFLKLCGRKNKIKCIYYRKVLPFLTCLGYISPTPLQTCSFIMRNRFLYVCFVKSHSVNIYLVLGIYRTNTVLGVGDTEENKTQTILPSWS